MHAIKACSAVGRCSLPDIVQPAGHWPSIWHRAANTHWSFLGREGQSSLVSHSTGTDWHPLASSVISPDQTGIGLAETKRQAIGAARAALEIWPAPVPPPVRHRRGHDISAANTRDAAQRATKTHPIYAANYVRPCGRNVRPDVRRHVDRLSLDWNIRLPTVELKSFVVRFITADGRSVRFCNSKRCRPRTQLPHIRRSTSRWLFPLRTADWAVETNRFNQQFSVVKSILPLHTTFVHVIEWFPTRIRDKWYVYVKHGRIFFLFAA